jgi:hypothetical protein
MRVIACLIAATLACTAALAQTGEPRRRMYPTQDGFLEVDPRTGAITECKRAADGYRCERVTESDVLLKEEPGPQAQAPAAPRQPDPAPRAPLPTDAEIDRALDVMERFLRRFMGIVREQKPERT